MRTTVDIDDRVLAASRSRARIEGITIGQALSRMALRGLAADAEAAEAPPLHGGVRTLPLVPGHVITDEMVEGALAEDG